MIAKLWLEYVRDTEIDDPTPPPAPGNIQVVEQALTWDADADLESGIAYFEIFLDGKRIGQVPEKPSNPFGRPLFQGLQYSDTPVMPLAQTRFPLEPNMPRDPSRYHVVTFNTRGHSSVLATRKP